MELNLSDKDKLMIIKKRWWAYAARTKNKGEQPIDFETYYEKNKHKKIDVKRMIAAKGRVGNKYAYSKVVAGVGYKILREGDYFKFRVQVKQDFNLTEDNRIWANVDINELPKSFCHWLKRLDGTRTISKQNILGYKISQFVWEKQKKSGEVNSSVLNFYIDGFNLIDTTKTKPLIADYKLIDEMIWKKLITQYNLLPFVEP